MDQHNKLLVDILENGSWVSNKRTGSAVRSVFGRKLVYNTAGGVPLITTRAVPWKNSIKEQLWMISGSTDNRILLEQNVPVWRLWDLTEDDIAQWGGAQDARGNPIDVGSCGPIYGAMWRNWSDGEQGVDQLAYVIDTLRANPGSRRIVVSAWNPGVLPHEDKSPQENVLLGRQCLAQCHTLFQLGTTALSAQERVTAGMRWLAESPVTQSAEVLDHNYHILKDLEQLFRGKAYNQYPSAFGRCLFRRKNGYLPRKTDDCWLSPARVSNTHDTLDVMGIPRYRLDMRLYARSQDVPLGTVFTQFAYVTFLLMIAQQVDMIPGFYHHVIGDAHIYQNQLEGVLQQIRRKPVPFPMMSIRKKPSIFDYTIDDFRLIGYAPAASIKFPLTK